jgi:hypothetical protein
MLTTRISPGHVSFRINTVKNVLYLEGKQQHHSLLLAKLYLMRRSFEFSRLMGESVVTLILLINVVEIRCMQNHWSEVTLHPRCRQLSIFGDFHCTTAHVTVHSYSSSFVMPDKK